ncbi:hypothetical protein [Mesorhizobium sp.]|uniref:hypothetical protein n=1 Tax=Mesorhizobium sp. TaxID=1871066 RepID=UPI0025E535C2|nr:hypothetical protein [Mesorhizobium sp.]
MRIAVLADIHGNVLALQPAGSRCAAIAIAASSSAFPPAHVSEQDSRHARYGIVELDASGRSEAIAIAYDHEAAAKQAEQADDWNGRTRRGPDL